MRLLPAGRPGCKIEANKFICLLFFVFLFYTSAFPQIPLNGLYSYSYYKISKGYNHIYPVEKSDPALFILTSQNEKGFLLVELSAGTLNVKEHFYKTGFAIDKAVIIRTARPNEKLKIGFISRKEMTAGILEIDKLKKLSTVNTKKLSSFPSELSAGDLNNDGNTELIVCGANFNGISILSSSGGSFNEVNFETGNYYSRILPADANNDSYVDLLAYDYINRRIKFLYNYGNASFYKGKEIYHSSPVSSLKYHYNSLFVSSGNTIDVFKKSKEGAYNISDKVKSQEYIDNFLINDVNDDKIPGIACINRAKSYFSLFPGAKGGGFTEEYLPADEKSLSDFCYSRNGNSEDIYLLSAAGQIIKLNNSPDKFSIEKLGKNTAAAGFFDNFRKNEKGFYYYDKSNKTFYIGGINGKGIVTILFPIKIFNDFENVTAECSRHQKRFYCYTKGQKTIDIISYSSSPGKITIKSVYLEHPVYSVIIPEPQAKNAVILVKNKGSLEEGKLGFENNEYTYSKIKTASSKYSNIFFGKETLFLTDNRNPGKITISYLTGNKKNENIEVENAAHSIILAGDNFSLHGKIILINGSGDVKYYDILNNETGNLNVSNNNLLYFNNINDFVFDSDIIPDASGYIYFYNKKNKQFCKISYKDNTLNVKPLFTENDMREFSVLAADKKVLLVAYSGKKNTSLKLKRILNED
jgi:hypothetical protein